MIHQFPLERPQSNAAFWENIVVGLWTSLIACFILVAFTTVFSCAGGGGGDGADGDDATGDDDAGSCDIDDSSMMEIPFSFDGSDCSALGLAIVVDRLYANSSLTAFKVAGQFSIDNDNVFYLRTTGEAQQDPCYDKIENSGTFEIGAGYFECTTNIQVDVVASMDSGSASFCGFSVQNEVGCDGSDDDADDDADDDSNDDDTEECEAVLDGNVETCFDGLTTEDVCASSDADCWVACFESESTETCADWLDCLVSDCGYSDDDIDDDDDDFSGTAPVLSDGNWNPDPAADDGSGAIVSTLVWDVCDEDDDLSGGQIFVWITGTQTAALSGDIFWDDFTEGAPSAPDCGSPEEVGIGVDFSALVPFGDDVCVDIEATDGEGNLSNLLENICVFVP